MSASMSDRNCAKWYSNGEASQSLCPRPATSMQMTREWGARAAASASKSRALPL